MDKKETVSPVPVTFDILSTLTYMPDYLYAS